MGDYQMHIRFLLSLAVITLVYSQGTPADAQWRGRGDWRGEDRGGEDRSRDEGGRSDRGRRGGFDPEQFWKDRDANKDGIIDPKELDERTRGWLRSDKPVKISELVSRFERDRGGRGERDRDSSNSSSKDEKLLVPGFGVEADGQSTVPGFGPPEVVEETEDRAAPTSESKSSSTAPATGGAVSSNSYVDGVFKQRDTNGNGTLEGDELSAPGLPPRADKDGDGKLTKQELMEATGSKSSSSSSNPSSPSGRRSYRFPSPHDRLIGSAKSWIVSRDQNGDGQVAMHEFSRTWTESKVREFQRYDLNGDGIVTASEYAER